MLHQIKKGLDLPITGDPDKTVIESKVVGSVALLGTDSIGLKPTMQVAVGDSVKIGQVIFTDKKTPGVKYTSPANGEVVAINRGAQRMLQSVVINITGEEAESFASYSDDQIPDLHESNDTIDVSLADLEFETLNPGADALEKIQKSWS